MKPPEKYRAVEVYFPHGWKAQVYTDYAKCYVTINPCPIFNDPLNAIQWGKENWK